VIYSAYTSSDGRSALTVPSADFLYRKGSDTHIDFSLGGQSVSQSTSDRLEVVVPDA